MNTQEYVEALSNADLAFEFQQAKYALEKAAREEPESEWHQSCFAAVMLFIYEMAKREINRHSYH